MGEDNKFLLDDFSFDILCCYIRYGCGDAKIYQTRFFYAQDDAVAVMSLKDFFTEAVVAREKAGLSIPAEDIISRKAVLDITAETGALETQQRVKELPSVLQSDLAGLVRG